jgi:hypothetical protein
VEREDAGDNRGYVLGYNIASSIFNGTGQQITMGHGAKGFGLAGWHWGKIGVTQCDVQFSEDEPLHNEWGGDVEVDMSIKRSTLLTRRVCIRWEEDVNEKDTWCADWDQLLILVRPCRFLLNVP